MRGTVVGWIVGFSLSIGHAAVLHVPGDYTGIQKAIDAASNGDVILVSPGVYNENINFKGKAVTLSSTNPADPNVVKSYDYPCVGPKQCGELCHWGNLELGSCRLYDYRRLRNRKS